MIRPEELTEDQHGPRVDVEQELEHVFDEAILHAAASRTWPAMVLRLPWSGKPPTQVAVLNVSARYRDAGWDVVLEGPDRSVLAMIRRR